MKRKLLKDLNLGSVVKLIPQGKLYTVVMSKFSNWKPALEDDQGKVKEVLSYTSVYVIKEG